MWEKFQKQAKAGENPKEVLDGLGLRRYCCRALFLGHVDLLEEVARYKKF